jgi:hypothetical protein
MSIFAEVIDDLFSDENLACSAVYRVGGAGPEKTIRAMFGQPMRDMAFGETGAAARDITASIRLSEIAKPKRGDTIEIGNVIYRVEQALHDSIDATATLTLAKL